MLTIFNLPEEGQCFETRCAKKVRLSLFQKNIIPESGKFFPLFLFFVFFSETFLFLSTYSIATGKMHVFLFAFLHLLCYNKRAI